MRNHLVLVPPNGPTAPKPVRSDKERQHHSSAIVRNIKAYRKYPFTAISKLLLRALNEIADTEKAPQAGNVRVIIRLLECYLCVTRKRISLRKGALFPRQIILDFGGALWSERFLDADLKRRHALLSALRTVAIRTGTIASASFPPLSTLGTPIEWTSKRNLFDNAELDPEQVAIYRAWPVLGHFNRHQPDLRRILLRYGPNFASSLQAAMQRFHGGRKQQQIPGLPQFIEYLNEMPNSWKTCDFHSPQQTAQLFSQFALHFAQTQGETQSDYKYIARRWKAFAFFLVEVVFPANVIAKPQWGLPVFPIKGRDRTHTHRRRNANGTIISDKIITDVPLELSDDEALDIIFKRIDADMSVVRAWGNHRVNEMAIRHQRFEQLAQEGVVREIGKSGVNITSGWTSRSHPRWRENACATFKETGFTPSRDIRRRLPLIYGGLKDLPSLFALPTVGALLPHMAVLVLEHPLLTASHFTRLELFDKHAHVRAISQIDAGWVLEGHKLRKGASSAQQTFVLSKRSIEVLNQVIQLTEPLRNYLRAKSDANWRHLFLHCGKGFSYPAVVRPTQDAHNFSSRMKREFAQFHSGNEAELERFAQKTTLTTIRAQRAVAEYIKDPDIGKVAKMLGHQKLELRQMERYIPAPLLAFFNERWIRLFQCAILLEILKDSPHQLRATGLSSMEQVHAFLKSHALSLRPEAIDKARVAVPPDSSGTVVFGLNLTSLTVLESLRLAVHKSELPCVPRAREWARLGDRLLEYIKNARPVREDLVMMLEEAQRASDPDAYKALIHDQ